MSLDVTASGLVFIIFLSFIFGVVATCIGASVGGYFRGYNRN